MVRKGGVVAPEKVANHRATRILTLVDVYHAGTTKVKKNRSSNSEIQWGANAGLSSAAHANEGVMR